MTFSDSTLQSPDRTNLKACHCCGLIHRLPPLHDSQNAICTRCGSVVFAPRRARLSAIRTAAAALAALILYFPAIMLPILKIDRLGHRHESSILGGIVDLFAHGSYFVGIVVLVFSIVFPLAKIVLLLELSWLSLVKRQRKAWIYWVMENVGKWSMMDVMLLAFMVMLVKLGDLVQFQFGPAVIAFVLCVSMNMIASFCFDPHSIWEESVDE